MDLKDLSKPLTVDQIDFRIQSINKGGYATILAYKDARVDMQRLDDVCGPLNWKREHTRDNANCVVSIWDEFKVQWVSKEDTGTESFTEAQKGLASDSFKRACFNWGVGRELYDYPVISIKLNDDEYVVDGNKVKQTYKLRLRDWKWKSYFEDSCLRYLKAFDEKNKERFLWFSLDGLMPTADVIKAHLEREEWVGAFEAWDELSEGEQAALWVPQSKGGPFHQDEKKLIHQLPVLAGVKSE